MKTKLSAFLAITSITATVSHAALISHWKFDEFSGTTAADSAGSFNGILSGGAAFVPGGISGNAVSLVEATNSLVNMGTSFPGFTTGDFSISLWMKTTTTEIDSLLIAKHEAFSQNGYFLVVNQTGGGGQAGKGTFNVGEFVSQSPVSTTTINDGIWHQLVGVFSAGGVHSIYVDGAPLEASTISHSVPANSAPLLIGGANVSGSPQARYTGAVDDVQIYNEALTGSQVQYLFDNPGQAVPEPGSLALLVSGSAILLRRKRK